jgi:hypothetical protein
MKKITFFFAVLSTCAFLPTFGQDWHPGDTINTAENDSIRISDFRDNIINYTGQDLVDAAFPYSWPLFGNKARMAIGGYIKLDYIQDFDGAYDRFQYEIQNVPVAGDGRPDQSGYMNLFARETRFNFDIRSISEAGTPFQIFIEMDFFNLDRGAFNQAPRLRHAYGVMGRLLVGRTWGTQSDLFAVPATIDFAAGDALTGTRRAQIRWEDKLGSKFTYALGLEMLEFPGIDGRDTVGQASQLLPLLAGRITKKTKRGGRLMIGASVFQLRWDGLGDMPNATAIGWGFSFSGREYFGTKKHYFRWMASYGQGWGSQIVATIGTQSSAIVTPQGTLETMPAYNLGGGVAFRLSNTLVTNINSNWYSIDPSQYKEGYDMKAGIAGHVNMIWSPIKSINTGIEYMILQRTNVNDTQGTGKRLQLMVKYLF